MKKTWMDVSSGSCMGVFRAETQIHVKLISARNNKNSSFYSGREPLGIFYCRPDTMMYFYRFYLSLKIALK